MTNKKNKKGIQKKTVIFNVLFILVTGGGLLFLWNAPPIKTPKLPLDEDHKEFHHMKKRAAKEFCADCHNKDDMPLPDNINDHKKEGARCLFCHRQQK